MELLTLMVVTVPCLTVAWRRVLAHRYGTILAAEAVRLSVLETNAPMLRLCDTLGFERVDSSVPFYVALERRP